MSGYDYTADVTRIMSITGQTLAQVAAASGASIYQDGDGIMWISGRSHAAAWERYSDRIDGQIKAAANPKPTHRANAFAGTCTACRQHVPAGAGRIDQVAGRWVVQHLDCSTQTRASDAAIRRAGGSVYAARTGSHGQCEDCGRTTSLTAGRCWDCNNI